VPGEPGYPSSTRPGLAVKAGADDIARAFFFFSAVGPISIDAHLVASPTYQKGETQLDAACTAACVATEVACQAAAAAALIDEPEGGIACGAADVACEAACDSRRRLQVTDGEVDDPHVLFWHEFQKAYAKDPAFICHTPLHEDRD
jgi:hypothetical protein